METAFKPRRVKVYQLNKDSEWVDKGTGICSCLHNIVSFILSFNERFQRPMLTKSNI